MIDTIFALSSGALPAAIAVIRISGPAAFAVAEAIAGRLPERRRAGLRRLRDPATGETLDHGLVLMVPGPDSVTGDDVAELHVHGARAIVRAVERVLLDFPGCRAADAGEFTRRALEAGRIDLTEAEGLADLLAAETEGQRRAALRSVEGGLRRWVERWTDRAVSLAAMIEAAIDHSDEADVADEVAIMNSVKAGAIALADDIALVLAQPSVERLRDGVRVVLAGPPNSGKSSLFNAMIGRDAAIVSSIPGTTRDLIEASVVRDGIAWVITDTAGLTDTTDDPIETIGIARSHESVSAADIVLWLGDGPPDVSAVNAILVHARADMADRRITPSDRVPAQSVTVGGDRGVWEALTDRARQLLPTGDVPAVNHRQRVLCCNAEAALRHAGSGEPDPLIIAEELRWARSQFDNVTGRGDVEAVLDALFSQFCIGK